MNQPLSSNEQTKVALFLLSLLPTLGLGGGGFLIVAYGLYMLNKQADPSFIEVIRKLFTGYSKIVCVLLLFVSVAGAYHNYVRVRDHIQESTANLAVYTEEREDLYTSFQSKSTESVTTQTTPQGFIGLAPLSDPPEIMEQKAAAIAEKKALKKQALDQRIGLLDDIIGYCTDDINKGYSGYVLEVLLPAFIAPIIPILYIWMLHSLFYTPLSKHKEWVAANGIFSTTPAETKHTRTTPLISFGKTASIADELIKLNSLKEANLITVDEFNALRSKLLS